MEQQGTRGTGGTRGTRTLHAPIRAKSAIIRAKSAMAVTSSQVALLLRLRAQLEGLLSCFLCFRLIFSLLPFDVFFAFFSPALQAELEGLLQGPVGSTCSLAFFRLSGFSSFLLLLFFLWL